MLLVSMVMAVYAVAAAQPATLSPVPVEAVDLIPGMTFPAPTVLLVDGSKSFAERAADPVRMYIVEADAQTVMAWAMSAATESSLKLQPGLPDGYPEVPAEVVAQWWRFGEAAGYVFLFSEPDGSRGLETYFVVQRQAS